MNPSDILFQTIGNLTGGLIIDVQTAMVGVVALLVVMLGIDLLKDVLLSAVESRRSEKAKCELWSAVGNAGMDWEEFKKEENLRRAKSKWREYDREL